MARKTSKKLRKRRHIALIIETSLASGRSILQGVARYAREHGNWAIYHEPHDLEGTARRWLRNWQGDGVLVRVSAL